MTGKNQLLKVEPLVSEESGRETSTDISNEDSISFMKIMPVGDNT
jgi:hypothetical protein